MSAAIAGLAAAAGCWLLTWSAPPGSALPSAVGRAAPLAAAVTAGLAAVAFVSLWWIEGTRGAVLVVGIGLVVGVLRSAAHRRAERAREDRRARVVEVGEAMVGELRAGQPPGRALVRAGEIWPELAPVVAASRLGADVPTALRRASARPGAEGLFALAAAWQVAERSGAALTAALSEVVASARGRRQACALVAGELASARATARLVAVLPFGTLAMTAGIGGDPWTFLLDRPAGVACLAAGVGLILAGLWWIDAIAGSVLRR